MERWVSLSETGRDCGRPMEERAVLHHSGHLWLDEPDACCCSFEKALNQDGGLGQAKPLYVWKIMGGKRNQELPPGVPPLSEVQQVMRKMQKQQVSRTRMPRCDLH